MLHQKKCPTLDCGTVNKIKFKIKLRMQRVAFHALFESQIVPYQSYHKID